MQIILSPNLNSALSLDWLTSGGQRLKSRIFGLCYFDPATGQNVLIGEAPYSGEGAEDGHSGATNDPLNHYGAWPADGYYGNTNNAWTDFS